MNRKDHHTRMAFDGSRLKHARLLREKTQRDLAYACNLTDRMISRYEHGHGIPLADTIAHLAKELRVSSDYLLSLADTPEPVHLTPRIKRILAAFEHFNEAELESILTAMLTLKRAGNHNQVLKE